MEANAFEGTRWMAHAHALETPANVHDDVEIHVQSPFHQERGPGQELMEEGVTHHCPSLLGGELRRLFRHDGRGRRGGVCGGGRGDGGRGGGMGLLLHSPSINPLVVIPSL